MFCNPYLIKVLIEALYQKKEINKETYEKTLKALEKGVTNYERRK